MLLKIQEYIFLFYLDTLLPCLFYLQTLLTAETATLRDDEGKTVMHTSTDLGMSDINKPMYWAWYTI